MAKKAKKKSTIFDPRKEKKRWKKYAKDKPGGIKGFLKGHAMKRVRNLV